MWIPLLAGAGILMLVAKGAAAAPAARGYARGARAAWNRWRTLILRYPSPIPPGVMALRIARESGGNPAARALGKVVGGSEWGLTQIYAPWSKRTRSGARAADVDPLDPAGAIYGAQWIAHHTRLAFERDLPGAGKDVPPLSNVRAWIVLMEVEHSIGYGGVMRIMRRWRDTRDPLRALELELGSPRAVGRMSVEKVAMRIRRKLAIPDEAAKIAPLPSVIGPLPERGAEVPRFNVRRLKAIDERYEL